MPRLLSYLIIPLLALASCERESPDVPGNPGDPVAEPDQDGAAGAKAAPEQPLPDEISFNQHIQPVLSEYCYACHGPDSSSRKPKAAPIDPATLPEIPERSGVISELEGLRSAMTQCAGGRRGVAELDLRIANTGRIAHAVVGGDFAGTPEGSCIARAVRRARFGPFRKARFRIIYPYKL